MSRTFVRQSSSTLRNTTSKVVVSSNDGISTGQLNGGLNSIKVGENTGIVDNKVMVDTISSLQTTPLSHSHYMKPKLTRRHAFRVHNYSSSTNDFEESWGDDRIARYLAPPLKRTLGCHPMLGTPIHSSSHGPHEVDDDDLWDGNISKPLTTRFNCRQTHMLPHSSALDAEHPLMLTQNDEGGSDLNGDRAAGFRLKRLPKLSIFNTSRQISRVSRYE